MSHWLLEKLDNVRQEALKQAGRAQIRSEVLNEPFSGDAELIRRTADGLEMVVLGIIIDGKIDDESKQKELRFCAADAFRLLRILPRPSEPLESAKFVLRASILAVIGDMGGDAARWLREYRWYDLPVWSVDFGERTWATIIDIWLRLIRKQGLDDLDTVLQRISSLRDSQALFEKDYLFSQNPANAKGAALELIGLYHLAKAAEILANYMTGGVVDGKHRIHQLLDAHFDQVLSVCEYAQMLELVPLSRLLAACASQMVENSIKPESDYGYKEAKEAYQ